MKALIVDANVCTANGSFVRIEKTWGCEDRKGGVGKCSEAYMMFCIIPDERDVLSIKIIVAAEFSHRGAVGYHSTLT